MACHCYISKMTDVNSTFIVSDHPRRLHCREVNLLVALTSSFNSQVNPLRFSDIWQETVNSEMLKTFVGVNIRRIQVNF
jgi:hypothetical protein